MYESTATRMNELLHPTTAVAFEIKSIHRIEFTTNFSLLMISQKLTLWVGGGGGEWQQQCAASHVQSTPTKMVNDKAPTTRYEMYEK